MDRITIPSQVLLRERRKSIGQLSPTPNIQDDSGLAPDPRQSRRETLPSLQLRRWQKVGRVMGVALGMKILGKTKRTASDPELETATVEAEEPFKGSSEDDYFVGPGAASIFSLDTSLAELEMSTRKRRRSGIVRTSSDIQSDSILADHSMLLKRSVKSEDENEDIFMPVPQVHVISPGDINI